MNILPEILWRMPDEYVYLTFDDGPDSAITPALLRLLAEFQIPVTFFVIGKKVEQHPGILAKIQAAGHAIGNHSFSHTVMTWKSRLGIERELTQTDKVILRTTGKTATLFRPPHGRFGPNLLRSLRAANRKMVLWNHSTKDYRATTTTGQIQTRLHTVRPGQIVLLHDGHANSGRMLTALKNALPDLLERKVKFKALPC
ncbi:MAG: polysaccharide deacetylase family protein [Calditrichaeota bacterium]|nr:polysaccharide deacetylase family protein [Calditrichota bacterium]